MLLGLVGCVLLVAALARRQGVGTVGRVIAATLVAVGGLSIGLPGLFPRRLRSERMA